MIGDRLRSGVLLLGAVAAAAAVVAIALGTTGIVRRALGPEPAPRWNAIPPTTPRGLRGPAATPYRDKYAGFQVDPPAGWVEYVSHFGHRSWAPRKEALYAYPDHVMSREHPDTFTLTVQAHQHRSLALWRESLIGGAGEREFEFQEQWFQVAGRKAVSIRTSPRLPTCRCVEETILISWDEQTLIVTSIVAGSHDAYDRHSDSRDRLLDSIRPGPVDPAVLAVRAFLESRMAGRDAERWLSARAAETFQRFGLYAVENGETDYDIERFTVESVHRMGPLLATFDVFVGGHQGGQRERLLIGATNDDPGELVVLDMWQIQAPDTS